MKKAILLIAIGLLATFSVQAQDIIITKKSDRIEAKVIKVTDSEVQFKSAANPDGSTITLPIARISAILYANGEVRSFGNENDRPPVEESVAPPAPKKDRNGGGFELDVNVMLASTSGSERKGGVLSGNLGLGYRFSQRFYWGINVGLTSHPIWKISTVGSGNNATRQYVLQDTDPGGFEVGTTLRPTFPFRSGKAGFFVDFHVGAWTYVYYDGYDDDDGYDKTVLCMHIMPGLQYPLSNSTDFLISAGYNMIATRGIEDLVPSFGMMASFVFHGNKLPKVKKPKISWD